jgi:hypothetical protein
MAGSSVECAQVVCRRIVGPFASGRGCGVEGGLARVLGARARRVGGDESGRSHRPDLASAIDVAQCGRVRKTQQRRRHVDDQGAAFEQPARLQAGVGPERGDGRAQVPGAQDKLRIEHELAQAIRLGSAKGQQRQADGTHGALALPACGRAHEQASFTEADRLRRLDQPVALRGRFINTQIGQAPRYFLEIK